MGRLIYIPAAGGGGWTNSKSLNLGSSNTNKAVNLGNTAFSFGTNDPRTVSCWVKLGASGVFQRFVDNQHNTTYVGWQFGIMSSNILIFQMYNGNSLDIRSVETVSTGAWHHYAMTYDGSNAPSGVAMYIDGAAVTKVTSGNNLSGSTTSTDNLYVGRAPDGSSFLQGQIDELAIFNAALSAGNISTLYHSGVPNDISAMANLVSLYRFEDNLNDSKGSNNGTGLNIAGGDYSTNVP